MLTLVLGDNLLLMFVGWEGVGLCSYVLIGFWYSDRRQRARRQQGVHRQPRRRLRLRARHLPALLGARRGRASDASPSARWQQHVRAPRGHDALGHAGAATLVTLLLFVGATGKSAQIPLYVWLPDAMAGPTPVIAR